MFLPNLIFHSCPIHTVCYSDLPLRALCVLDHVVVPGCLDHTPTPSPYLDNFYRKNSHLVFIFHLLYASYHLKKTSLPYLLFPSARIKFGSLNPKNEVSFLKMTNKLGHWNLLGSKEPKNTSSATWKCQGEGKLRNRVGVNVMCQLTLVNHNFPTGSCGIRYNKKLKQMY